MVLISTLSLAADYNDKMVEELILSKCENELVYTVARNLVFEVQMIQQKKGKNSEEERKAIKAGARNIYEMYKSCINLNAPIINK